MEKYIIFGVLVILFLIFVFKMVFKKNNSSWKGKVLEKSYIQKKENDRMNEYFSVKVELEGGNKEITVAVSKILYNNVEEGDKLEKQKGSPYPKKI